MVEAVVEFDYTAQESDELTIRKGDKINDVKTQLGGWWEGTLGGKRGMFPDNFVKILATSESSNNSTMQNDVTLRPKSGRCCKVLFSYQPVNEDELKLQVDDIIDVIGEVEDGWWKGKLRDKVGMFPSNFVTEISGEEAQRPRPSSRDEASESDGERSTSVSSPDSSQLLDASKSDLEGDIPLLPPKPVKEQCRAVFAYEAANNDELSLKEGDIVNLLSRDVQDKGWWRGELKGLVGLFPDNFVELIPSAQVAEEPPKKPERTTGTTNRARDSITKPPVKTDVPPVPGKKPQLPVKKTERVSTANPLGDSLDGAGPSRISRSMEVGPASPSGQPEVLEFDSIERSAMLTHPTASRAKAPGRRPPSSSFVKDVDSPSLTNGTSTENLQEESSKKSWEKQKAPWMEELKKNQARKSVEQPKGVSVRNVRPQSMYSDLGNPPKSAVTPPVKLLRLIQMPKLNLEVDTVSTDTPVKEARSNSMGNHSKDGVSVPLAKANSFRSEASSVLCKQEPYSPSKTNLNNSTAESKVENGFDMETVVKRLGVVELQQEIFIKTIKELTQKLNEETQKRIQIELQLNKLTDLVTQV